MLWACLPFWPSLSYTFIWTNPLVLFLRITGFRPSLLVTVPSCADSSSAHQSLPPVTINVICWYGYKTYSHRCRFSKTALLVQIELQVILQHYVFFTKKYMQMMLWCKQPFKNALAQPNTNSKCKWRASAFTLIHRGWHSYAIKPLNNWSILWADLRLKTGIPCSLLCPLADDDACMHLAGFKHCYFNVWERFSLWQRFFYALQQFGG